MINKRLILILTIVAGHAAFSYCSEPNTHTVEKNISELLRTNECRGCYLYGADLRKYDLHNADLEGSDLRGANFDRTIVNGVNFKGVQLNDAQNLDSAVYKKCTGHEINKVGKTSAELAKLIMDGNTICQNINIARLIRSVLLAVS